MAEPRIGGSKKKSVLRRDFLVGSGTAIATGALAACTPESAVAAITEAVPDNRTLRLLRL
jgi:hypothetical protein